MFLKQADVHILAINSMAFRINTTQDSYKRVRTILLTLKEQCSLPLHLHSEEVAEIHEKVKSNKCDSVADHSSNFVYEEDLPPRYGNMFLVVGHLLIGKDQEKMLILAKEVAQRLELFGLTVIVHT